MIEETMHAIKPPARSVRRRACRVDDIRGWNLLRLIFVHSLEEGVR
jgi:hypothetical protein